MSQMLIAPELELFPNRYRWSVAACYRMMELGFLEGRFEVIDGEVIPKTGQKPPHAQTLTLVLRVLAALFGIDFVCVQSPITLTAPDNVYTEPEPDLAVTREPVTAYSDHHPGPGDLHLVVEVADTTLRADLKVKALLYARSHLPEYWVVDIVNRKLHLHRDPQQGGYASIQVYEETQTFSLPTYPEAVIAVRDLLPPA